MTSAKPNIILSGATGTIGQAVLHAALEDGHRVTALVRNQAKLPKHHNLTAIKTDFVDPLDVKFGKRDIIISCLASRTGSHDDAWAIDYQANVALMKTAETQGIKRFVLLSAICVQKPKLAFQNAKRAFEARLRASQLDWTIVHPTAFFKSLSGQFERVKNGKPFLVFGDGTLTKCKPISDTDLARFILNSALDADTKGKTLPIGGPGPAITPLDQARLLHDALGKTLKVKHVPIALMKTIAGTLGVLSHIIPSFQGKAEFARTGLYYATESMLVWDAHSESYSEDLTPGFGTDSLLDHYKAMASGEITVDLGDHAVFSS